jgi:ABC-type polysaccharide/polyol phosphate transport system ATPase subunit
MGGAATNDVVVSVRGVSKRFLLPGNSALARLKHFLPRRLLRDPGSALFTALRNISLELRRGEVVGVIGPNGSGKTTLLKLIAGLLPIDEGSIGVNGKVTALLALGVGVSPDFTGRENIVYGGLLLGMTRREIEARMAQIVEFAELGAFIDQPFRTYSSGMRARLLFSISMSLTPDILIVDEALATGDAAFVQKCFGRISEIVRSGATVLFVSHNLGQIRQLCTRCIVLDKGALVFDGKVEDALEHYYRAVVAAGAAAAAARREARGAERFRNLGTGEVGLVDMYLAADGRRTDVAIIGCNHSLVLELTAARALRACVYVELRTQKSVVTYAFVPPPPPFYDRAPAKREFQLAPGRNRLTIDFAPLVLGDGQYACDVELYPADSAYVFAYETCYCYCRRALEFTAAYEDVEFLGRGTLTEIPVAAMRVAAHEGRDE